MPATRFLLLLLLFAGLLSIANAQTACNLVLSGNISDSDTKEPLSLAVIEFVGKKLVISADEQGNFKAENLCPGDYTLSINHLNCESMMVNVRLNKNTVRNFVLPHRTNELREIVVLEKFKANQTSARETVTLEQLQERRGLSLAENLQGVGGVSLLQTGPNIFKPIVNGLHGNRLQIVSNGIRLESQQWGSEHAPEIDPFSAGKITVLKGAGALMYGSDALAGTILVEPGPLPSQGEFKGEVFTSFFSNNRASATNLVLEGNSKKVPAVSWRAQGNFKKSGNSRTPDYYLWNTGAEEWNGSFTLGYRKPYHSSELYASVFNAKLGIFLGSQIGNLTDLLEAIRQPEPLFNKNSFSYELDRPRQEVNHLTARYKFVYYKDPAHLFHISANVQQNRRKEFDLARITDTPELDLRLTTAQLDARYEHSHDNWMHTYGVVGMLQENVWDGSRYFIPNFRMLNGAAYHLGHYQKEKLEFEMGLRYDYRHLQTFRNESGNIFSDFRNWHNASASANLFNRVSDRFNYSLNTALSWRPPSINELYVNGLHHGTSSFEIGDPSMKNEAGIKVGLQLQGWLADSLVLLEGYVYNNFISNFIYLTPDTPATLTIRGAFPTFSYKQTRANLNGFDLKATLWPDGKLRFASMLSILYAFDLREATWIQQMPGNRATQELSYHLKSIGKFSKLKANLQWVSVFEQTRTGNKFIDYAAPPSTYHLFHGSFSGRYGKWYGQIGVNNLFNIRYREYLNRFRYFNQEIGRNIFIRLAYSI